MTVAKRTICISWGYGPCFTGTKSLVTIGGTLENAAFLAAFGIKLLVVAATPHQPLLCRRYEADRPGCCRRYRSRRSAVEVIGCEKPRIGVIATEATVASNAYPERIYDACDKADILQAACPLFVPLAEEGWTDEPETYSIAKRYLEVFKDFRPQALVMGCTHYPILSNVIQQTVGESVKLIDSGEATADEVVELLTEKGLHDQNKVSGTRRLCDDLDHFFVTDATERFGKVAERFLGVKPTKLEAVEVTALTL